MAGDKRRRRSSVAKKRAAVVGLVAFLALDVALVAYAVGAFDGDATAGPTFSAAPRPTASPSPSESPTPAPSTAFTELTPSSVLISAVDGDTAYRVAAGNCATGASLELEKSTDAGGSWVSTTVSTDLASALRLDAQDADFAVIVGLEGETCTPGLTATYTSGAGFDTYPDRLASTWYVVPGSEGTINSPQAIVTAPCDEPVSIAPRSDSSAALVCGDRNVYRTQDGGATWSDGLLVPGIVAMDSDTDGYVIASTGETTCTGAQIFELSDTAGSTPAVIGCSPGSISSSRTDIAMSAAGESLWLNAGQNAIVSVDGGRTW
jgi:hypothetical protein